MSNSSNKNKPNANLKSMPDVARAMMVAFLSNKNTSSYGSASKTTKEDTNVAKQYLLIEKLEKLKELINRPNLFSNFVKNNMQDKFNNYNENKTPEKIKKLEELSDIYDDLQNDRVLVMGGLTYNTEDVVMKMIIEQDDNIQFDIRFEYNTQLLNANDLFDVTYNQGEVFALSSFTPYASQGTVQRLDTLTQEKMELAEFVGDGGLCRATTAIFNNKLIIVGGFYEYENENRTKVFSDIVYELDDDTNESDQGKWKAQNAKINNVRYQAAVITFDGKIFLCGGTDVNGHHLRSVESFDPTVGKWQFEEEMTDARAFFSLCVFNDELYAMGGNWDGVSDDTTTIEKLSKDTKKWELVATCDKYRFGCASALVGTKVFLFGGSDSTSTFDYFDLHSKKWASEINNKYKMESGRILPYEFQFSKAVYIPSIEKQIEALHIQKAGSLLNNYKFYNNTIKNKIKDINTKLLNCNKNLNKINIKNIKYVKKNNKIQLKYYNDDK
jgi:hypothetical protein